MWGIFEFFLAPLLVGGLLALGLPLVFPIVPVTVDIWLVSNGKLGRPHTTLALAPTALALGWLVGFVLDGCDTAR